MRSPMGRGGPADAAWLSVNRVLWVSCTGRLVTTNKFVTCFRSAKVIRPTGAQTC